MLVGENLEKFCHQGNASFCPQPKNEERVPASAPVEIFKLIESPQVTKKYRSTRVSVGVLPTVFLYKQSGVTTPAYDFAKSSQSSFILGLNYELQDGIEAAFEWSNQNFSIARQNNSDIPFRKKIRTGVNLFYFYPMSMGSGYKNIYSSDFLLSVDARFQLTAYLDFVSAFGTNYQNFKINTSSTEFNADTLEQTSINYIFNFSLSTNF